MFINKQLQTWRQRKISRLYPNVPDTCVYQTMWCHIPEVPENHNLDKFNAESIWSSKNKILNCNTFTITSSNTSN